MALRTLLVKIVSWMISIILTAMYLYVPTKLRAASDVLASIALTPKSVILTSPLWFISKFEGLRSRWITCFSWWRYHKPLSTYRHNQEFISTWVNLFYSEFQTNYHLFTDYCKIWLWNHVNFLQKICKRSSIHVLQDYGDCAIIIETLIANYNVGALGWLVNF